MNMIYINNISYVNYCVLLLLLLLFLLNDGCDQCYRTHTTPKGLKTINIVECFREYFLCLLLLLLLVCWFFFFFFSFVCCMENVSFCIKNFFKFWYGIVVWSVYNDPTNKFNNTFSIAILTVNVFPLKPINLNGNLCENVCDVSLYINIQNRTFFFIIKKNTQVT